MPDQTFVLVHGAWQTAATWDLLVPILERQGCRVLVAALTGLEDDASALTPAVTLDTHVRDVARLVDRHDLQRAILVGHSYAGLVITAAMEHVPQRIAALAYIDAFVPEHGQCGLDLLPGHVADSFREQARADGGWRLRSSPQHLDLWGLEPGEARDFVEARLSDFSIRCFEEPVLAPATAAARCRRAYVACVRDGYPARVVFEPFARRARDECWPYHELPSGHDCQAEMPDMLAACLLDCVTAQPRERLAH